MTPHSSLCWLDCPEAARLLEASRSRLLIVGVNLLTWGTLMAFLGLFWWWVYLQIY